MDRIALNTKLISPNDVLIFWFGSLVAGELSTVAYFEKNMSRWFAGSDASFDQIQKDNTELVEYVANSTLNDAWNTPSGSLARVLLLDQFARCIYRGTPDAFQHDLLTAQIVKRIIDSNWLLTEYVPIQRFFLGVAIQHSEDICMQQIGLDIARLVGHGYGSDVNQYFNQLKGYPNEHYDVIKRFSRFPSRNDVLGRVSRAEEIQWMESPDCPAWAKSQLPK